MARSFELETVEMIAAASVGEPGSRQFYLLARGGTDDLTLACEKFHIQGLLTRARQLLETQEARGDREVRGGRPPEPPPVGEPDWHIGELGLGFHESKRRFVIVARELEAEAGDDPATARLWVTPDQVRTFADQAEQVLAGGRPTCNYCGLPIDPSGHPCPAANGSRPIF
ncbi:MAG: DUF3090 domain-containing protein [Candidatus Dormibacteraceae bacterium]